MASLLAIQGGKGASVYAASKAGIVGKWEEQEAPIVLPGPFAMDFVCIFVRCV